MSPSLNLRSDSPSRVVIAVLAQMLAGLACAFASLWTASQLSNSWAALSETSDRLLLDALFLLGMAPGFLISRPLMQRIASRTIWAAATLIALFVSAALVTSDSWLTAATLRFTAGTAVGMLRISAEYTLANTVSNHFRWRALGYAAIGFVSFAVCVSALDAVQSILIEDDSAMRSADLRASGLRILVAGVAIVPFILGGFPPLRALNAVSQTPEAGQDSPAGCAAASSCDDCPGQTAEGCDDHKHDHDHDHGPAVATESCGVEECCGGVAKSVPQTPTTVGVAFAGVGLLMLFGPVLDLVQSTVRATDALPSLALFRIGCALIVGVVVYRRGASQAGNALTLPIFLVMAAIAGILQAVADPVSRGGLFFSTMAAFSLAGCVHGCLAIVAEYFGNTSNDAAKDGHLSKGAVMAAAGMGVLALAVRGLNSETASAVIQCVVPLLCSVVCVVALRAIPQPIVVTRFAERFLKASTTRS